MTSSSNTLYFGGDFNVIKSSVAALRLGQYEQDTLNPLSGLTYDTDGKIKDAALMPDGDMVVVGSFSRIGGIDSPRIARWSHNTKTWSSVIEGCTGTISHIERVANSGILLTAGDFTGCDGSTGQLRIITNLDTPSLSVPNDIPAGILGFIGAITDIKAAPNGDLYLAGSTTENKALFVRYSPGSGTFSTNLAPSGESQSPQWLHITTKTGQSFETSVLLGGLASWGGQLNTIPIYKTTPGTWSSIPLSSSSSIRTLAGEDLQDLYAGGSFDSVGGANRLARIHYTNGTWTAGSVLTANTSLSASGTGFAVQALLKDGSHLLVGGSIFDPQYSGFLGFGIWNTSTQQWNHSFASNGMVSKIIPAPPGSPYLGAVIGDFTGLGTHTTSRIALIRKSELGSGSPYGVFLAQKNPSAPMVLLSTGKDLKFSEFDQEGGSWISSTVRLATNSPLLDPALAVTDASGTSAKAVWLEGFSLMTAEGTLGASPQWGAPTPLLPGYQVGSFSLEQSNNSIGKLIFLNLTDPPGVEFNVTRSPF